MCSRVSSGGQGGQECFVNDVYGVVALSGLFVGLELTRGRTAGTSGFVCDSHLSVPMTVVCDRT